MKKVKAASEVYQKFDQLEHVLKRPDTYLGSVNTITEPRWVIYKNDEEATGVAGASTGLSDAEVETSSKSTTKLISNCIVERKEVTYNKGLEHCVVELITNAVDHAQRCITEGSDELVTKIDICCDETTFSIKNNGEGIPIEVHKEHNIYIPEMIFGHLLTSSNYNDDDKRTWGGKNGIGAKAANVFSKEFVIEIQTKGKKYAQTFNDNLTKIGIPIITKGKGKDYTLIKFTPDFKRFNLNSFKDNDLMLLIEKRCFDASATTNKKVTVTFNGNPIPVKDFKNFVELYIGGAKKIIYEDPNERWKVGFALNPFDNHVQVSFVNGLSTEEGGTHVDHVLKPVLNGVCNIIQNSNKVKKEGFTIKPQYIKDNIIVFISCLIENPEFNSQTKDKLGSKVESFGSTCKIPEDIIEKVSKLGIIDNIISLAHAKELKNLQKTSSTSASRNGLRLTDIPKLTDANKAGSKDSSKCTLILTEGDSALGTAKEGLKVVGYDYWGTFPLKGKLLNVRGSTINQLSTNKELMNIMKIIGLTYGMSDFSKIRYHKILIMTDQDTDGFHIKGLLMNYFTYYWPKLIEGNFLMSLLTPIVKVYNNDQVHQFYDLNEYSAFIKRFPDNKFKIKYYKGLGTSTAQEAQEYFKELTKNSIMYTYEASKGSELGDGTESLNSKNGSASTRKGNRKNDRKDDQKNASIDDQKLALVFDTDKADNRKDWILSSIENADSLVVDYKQRLVSIGTFIDKELVQFSIYDNIRSIPNVIDGLKVSQRKVIYGSFLKKIFNVDHQIKVAQLGAFVSENTDYHHGEASLFGTIINMAQDFIGSNNLGIFEPIGQFGSREDGGKGAASPRYIFTCFKRWVPIVFNPLDDPLLEYNYEDSSKIEPKIYYPIIPMILINGSTGIGTGWSTGIPCFNPVEIINNLKKLLNGDAPNPMVPWYRNFRGKIVEDESSPNKWKSIGLFEKNKNELIVTELPIGFWTQDFEELLKKLMTTQKIKNYDRKNSAANSANSANAKSKAKAKSSSTSKSASKSASNDIENVGEINFIIYLNPELEEYSDQEIIKEFKLETMISATNMVAFNHKRCIHKYQNVEEILIEFYNVRLIIYNKRKEYLINKLTEEIQELDEKIRFIQMVINEKIVVFKRKKNDILQDLLKFSFKLTDELLDLKIHCFTIEYIEKYTNQLNDLMKERETLTNTTPKELWLNDLEKLIEFA